MRILFITPRQFWPIDTGAKLRDYHLARELAARAEVTYLGFADATNAGACPKDLGAPFADIVLEPRHAGHSVSNLARGLIGPMPVTVLNYTTRSMADRMRRLVTDTTFDVIQFEGMHLVSYLPLLREARGRPRLISDWHNIESELMARYAENAANPLVRLYAQATARRIAQIEDRLLTDGEPILVASVRERQQLLARAPGADVHVIENGVDVGAYAACRTTAEARGAATGVIFVGSMDYHANIDAVLWFVNEAWPAIRAAQPDLQFKIVGRSPPSQVLELAKRPGVIVTGSVPDVRPFYADAVAAVVPLRVGGGTRLKILESMAAGTPVISTTLGAEGLDATPEREILIADTAGAFQAAVMRLMRDKALGQRLAHAAAIRVGAQYDWTAIGERLFAIHQSSSRVSVPA